VRREGPYYEVIPAPAYDMIRNARGTEIANLHRTCSDTGQHGALQKTLRPWKRGLAEPPPPRLALAVSRAD
jgi:hypothetical protein